MKLNSNIILKPPVEDSFIGWSNPRIFLAGSIEMGKAENWQEKLQNDLPNRNLIIYNPRRDDWDSSWEQKITNKNFYEQVNWELSALERSDIIAMYFAPDTQSPISLLEFGLYANNHSNKMIVCCPDGFWRKGNIDVTAQRYGVPVHNNYDTWLVNIKNKIEEGMR